MKTPIYNKSELLYNLVFGKIEYNPPYSVFDYESMYKLISPFMLTNDVFEAGVKPPPRIIVTPDIMNSEELKEATKTEVVVVDPGHPTRITVTFDEKPHSRHSSLPPSKNQVSSQRLLEPILPKEPEIKIIPPSHQLDPLFWNIYIAIHGIREYECLNGKYTNFIVDEKQRIVNSISAQVSLKTTYIKSFMKQNKITGISMKEMLSGILSNDPVTFKDVSLYCLFYKTNITFVNHDKRMYFKVEGGENEENNDIYIELYLKTQQRDPPAPVKTYKYIVITDKQVVVATMAQMEKYYKLESLSKPLGPLSGYKVEDLKTIVEQLNIKIDGDSKIKKNDLYNMIDERIKEVV